MTATVHDMPPRRRPRPAAIPQPIPDSLSAVDRFDVGMVPESVGPAIMHAARCLSCPPDFVAISMLVGLGSVLGRRVAIRPDANTLWTVIANLWGLIIGEPSARKTPATNAGLWPLGRLEKEAYEKFKGELKIFDRDCELAKLKSDAATKRMKKALDNGEELNASEFPDTELLPPIDKRYRVNDATYEALGALMIANPNGLLYHRDEIISLFKYLGQEEHATARGFILAAWSGTQDYVFDRIGRGTLRIPSACLSILGTSQPGVIEQYLRVAVNGGSTNDGFMQRFQLMVWPDAMERRPVDEAMPADMERRVWEAFDHLDKLDPDAVGALRDADGDLPYLRFSPAARERFAAWDMALDARIQTMSPAMATHLGKYGSLVASLALINHLVDKGTGPVGLAALERAIRFSVYLESHARRAYGGGQEVGVAAARAILGRFHGGFFDTGAFTLRDIQRKCWAGLTDRAGILAGLDLLDDLDWISRQEVSSGYKGARTKMEYFVNPIGRPLWRKHSAAA